MATKADELKVYSFTDEDIDLITFSLRRLMQDTGSRNIQIDSANLITYIERLKKENQ